MRFVSSDPSEFSVIGVGQEAHGFFAFGQLARGVIAVGQIAIGVVAVGQVSFSILGVGQVGGAVAWFAGMGGVAGRGLCLRLIPGLDPPRVAPQEVSLDAVLRGHAQGFVRLAFANTPNGPVFVEGGHSLPIKLRPNVAWALTSVLASGALSEVYAELSRRGEVVVCRKIVEVPGQRSAAPHTAFNILRFVALLVLATVWCRLFAEYVLGIAF